MLKIPIVLGTPTMPTPMSIAMLGSTNIVRYWAPVYLTGSIFVGSVRAVGSHPVEQLEFLGMENRRILVPQEYLVLSDTVTATTVGVEQSVEFEDVDVSPSDCNDIFFGFSLAGSLPASGHALVPASDAHRNFFSTRIEGGIGDLPDEDDEIILDDLSGVD